MALNATQLAIANLLGNPTLTHQQIADLTGTSRHTVLRVNKKLKETAGGNIELEDYRGLIRKHLPSKKRVGVLQTVASAAKTNPFAAMRAVEYADQVLGLAPKQQQSDPGGGPQPPALFTLPANTRVAMLVQTGPDRSQTGGASQAIQLTVGSGEDA